MQFMLRLLLACIRCHLKSVLRLIFLILDTRHPDTLYLCEQESEDPRLFNYTHQQIHIYVLFNKSKIYIKTLKKHLHVSITRSSLDSIHCSLLKL